MSLRYIDNTGTEQFIAGGGGSVDIDNNTIVEDSTTHKIKVADALTQKLSNFDDTTKKLKFSGITNGTTPNDVLTWNGTTWESKVAQGGISPSDMLGYDTTQGETVDDGIARVENNTASGKVVDALVIKEYSNTYKSRIIVPIEANATGAGNWIAEGTTWTAELETTNGWIGYKDAETRALLTVSEADKNKVELQFMFEVVDENSEPISIGGYQWDTTTGMLCIKFGNTIGSNTNIAVDVIRTR